MQIGLVARRLKMSSLGAQCNSMPSMDAMINSFPSEAQRLQYTGAIVP